MTTDMVHFGDMRDLLDRRLMNMVDLLNHWLMLVHVRIVHGWTMHWLSVHCIGIVHCMGIVHWHAMHWLSMHMRIKNWLRMVMVHSSCGMSVSRLLLMNSCDNSFLLLPFVVAII